jgi:hypothetical protein
MSLLEKIESFVSKECIEIGSAVHQLLQRFVAHAEPQEPAPEPTAPPAEAAPIEQTPAPEATPETPAN